MIYINRNSRPRRFMNYIIKKVKFLYKRQGILGPIGALGRKFKYYGFRIPFNALKHLWTGLVARRRYADFYFLGKPHRRLFSFKNLAWTTERTIEVPIVMDYVKYAYARNQRILEVGNTLHQYSGLKNYDIVDKYEYRKGIINVDIEDFKPVGKYDLIVSVFTMEHVGWDVPDEPDPEKIPRVLRKMKDWLAPGGRAVITMPIGWNSEVDKRLKSGTLPFSEEHYMECFSKYNQWRETIKEQALRKKYGTPSAAGNAIVVGIIYQA